MLTGFINSLKNIFQRSQAVEANDDHAPVREFYDGRAETNQILPHLLSSDESLPDDIEFDPNYDIEFDPNYDIEFDLSHSTAANLTDTSSLSGFASTMPDCETDFDTIDDVKAYLNIFCRGDNLNENFKGFCYVIERSHKNSISFCCDRGGRGGSKMHSASNPKLTPSRNSTTRKTECSVRVVACRPFESGKWKLQSPEVSMLTITIILVVKF